MSVVEFVDNSAVQQTVRSLYSDHHGWLFGWLRGRLGNTADAADLAQDTFVRLLARSSALELRSVGEARAYLRTTAKNLCINLWHRQEIERAWLETLATYPEESYPSAERQAIVLEALQEIGHMLCALPARAAQAFLLAVACRMTDDEVAAQLGVSGRMVRKYVAQAMFGCLQLRARDTAAALREDGAR